MITVVEDEIGQAAGSEFSNRHRVRKADSARSFVGRSLERPVAYTAQEPDDVWTRGRITALAGNGKVFLAVTVKVGGDDCPRSAGNGKRFQRYRLACRERSVAVAEVDADDPGAVLGAGHRQVELSVAIEVAGDHAGDAVACLGHGGCSG